MSERRCASCSHDAHEGRTCLVHWGDAGNAEQCGCQWYEPEERRVHQAPHPPGGYPDGSMRVTPDIGLAVFVADRRTSSDVGAENARHRAAALAAVEERDIYGQESDTVPARAAESLTDRLEFCRRMLYLHDCITSAVNRDVGERIRNREEATRG